jgi:hypothetical protein
LDFYRPEMVVKTQNMGAKFTKRNSQKFSFKKLILMFTYANKKCSEKKIVYTGQLYFQVH